MIQEFFIKLLGAELAGMLCLIIMSVGCLGLLTSPLIVMGIAETNWQPVWKRIAKFGGSKKCRFGDIELNGNKLRCTIGVEISVPSRYAFRFIRHWSEVDRDYQEIVLARAHEMIREFLGDVFYGMTPEELGRKSAIFREFVTARLTKEFGKKGILINQLTMLWDPPETPMPERQTAIADGRPTTVDQKKTRIQNLVIT